MDLETKDYIILLGILLTFLATVLGYFFTRRNIKTSKYIEVVTTERIKWLETIRTEISDLSSAINQTIIYYRAEIKHIESEHPTQETMDEENYEFQKHYFESKTDNAFQKTDLRKKNEIISRLFLLKLRFNPDEDNEILNLIDYFITFYEKKYKPTEDLDTAKENVTALVTNIQSMLKTEWEKVKKESRGG